MKTVSGTIVSSKPVNLSKAANILSNFVSSDNGASQSVSTYLRRTCEAFNELVYFKKHHKTKKHRSLEESSSKSDINSRNSEDGSRVVENHGGVNKTFNHDLVEIDEKVNGNIEDKLEKKEKKKKKKSKGSLGNGEFEEDNEIVKENSEEKKKKKNKKSKGSLGNGEFEEDNDTVKENSEEKNKKKKKKKSKGSLGNGEFDEIVKENSEEKKKKKRKNAEVEGGESGNSSKKKKRRTEVDDE